MACSSCNKTLQLANESTKEINISSLSAIPQDQLINLYRQGYSIPPTYNTYNAINNLSNPRNKIQSLAIQDVSSLQYILLGLFSYGAYKMHESNHDIIAIILGGLALGTAGRIYYNLEK